MDYCIRIFFLALVMGFGPVALGQYDKDYESPQDWVIAKNYFATSLLYQDTTLNKARYIHTKPRISKHFK